MSIEGWIQRISILDKDSIEKIISALLILVILWLIRFFILKIVYHQTKSLNSRYSWRKGTLYSFVFLSIILIGRHWADGLEPFLAFLGIIAAGLTISMKEVLLNLAGMFAILWRNIFVVGDRVEVAQHKGDVVGIGVFYFSLMEVGEWVDAEQSTGRMIKIPNAMILSNPVINYTKGFPVIWDELSICITPQSDWKTARDIMQSIAERTSEDLSDFVQRELKHSEDELIHFQYLKPKVYMKPDQAIMSGILLTLRYLCEPRKRRDTENMLWEVILAEFEAAPNVEIARK